MCTKERFWCPLPCPQKLRRLQGEGSSIRVQHIFSCERDPRKLQILIKQGGMNHLFGDVRDFSAGRGFCFVCGVEHNIDKTCCAIDVLQSGTACTDISKCNNERRAFAGSYEGQAQDQNGVSGITYESGFRKAAGSKLWH